LLLEIHSICQKLNPQEKELIYICPKTRERHWFRNLGSFLTLQIINFFSRFKLRGIFSIRVIGKSSDTFVKIRPHFVFDLFLLSKGYEARYIETDFKISDKKGSYTFLKLSKVFLNITLFYTFLFESLAIVILCLYLLIKSFIIIVLFSFITLLLVFKYYSIQ
jgi:hypothetical protein